MFRISVWVGVFLLLASFVLPMTAQEPTASSSSVVPGTITGSGTADFIPRFTGATTIGNSNVFETIGGNVGVATTTPSAKLDVNGTGDVRDTLTLFPKLTHPSLSVHGTAFAVSNIGKVTFVAGQTFPGTGTVTSVGSGFGLTGGPITHTGSLAINTSVVPQLGASNTFTGNQSVNGNISATGSISANSLSGNGANVTNVNAALLGGQGPEAYLTLGYSATVPLGVDPPLTAQFPGTLIMQTNAIGTSGTYFISAGVLPYVASGDNAVFCYDTLASLGAGSPSQWGGSFQNANYAQASITDVLSIGAGDAVQVYCESEGSNGSYVFNAGLTATLINNSHKAKSARSRHPHANPEQVKSH